MDPFDNSQFSLDNDSDEFGTDQNGFAFTSSFRDSTLFLVDCTQSMFVQQEEENIPLFQKCMKAIQNMYQHKIYGSDRDLLGIVFFGTEKNNTGEDFLHIYMLQDLDQPSAERIKQIETLSANFNMKDFKTDYGHSDDFALDKVLWWCSNMFSMVTQKLDSKRIMLFTRRDHPHEKNKTLEKLAKNKAKDLFEIGIALEVVPVVLKDEKFDYNKFYGDILMLSEEQIKFLPDPAENFDELERTVRSKDHKRRPYTHLKLALGGDLAISCSVYNLVRDCPKPTKIKLDKKTNVETKSITRRYIPETGEILFASDTKLAIDVFDKRVTFEQDEVKAIKRFGNNGLELLGFKSFDCLKPYMFVKPGHFLYPDEKLIQGSTTLFRSLLEKCIEKKRFILCKMIPRVNTPPRLVALFPQEEELDEHKIQIIPPGFHVYYMPYADDFRQIDRKITAEANPEHIELFAKCINKLKFKYNPEDFKNPALQKLWNEIEAIALAREQSDEIIDLTLPNVAGMEKRAGSLLAEFAERFDLANAGSSTKTTAAKRKNEDGDQANKKVKASNDSLDVEAEARAGKLEKLTVPILKEFIKEKKISGAGTKKDDLIKAIKAHFKL